MGSPFLSRRTLKIMKLTIDFETRSPVDIRKSSPWKYAEDKDTSVMCLAVKPNDNPPLLWVPDKFKKYITNELVCSDAALKLYLEQADIIEAHNFEFERAIWQYHMKDKFGEIPFHKQRCSAAAAAVVGIPRALGKACRALGLSVNKDDAGNKVMRKLASPITRATKAVKERIMELDAEWTWDKETCMCVDTEGNYHYLWNEDPEDFTTLFAYCLQDVEAEHNLSENLPDLSHDSLEVWRSDQIINQRGIKADVVGCHAMVDMSDKFKDDINTLVYNMTNGEVERASQVARIKEWIFTKSGQRIKSLDADGVAKYLEDPDFPNECVELIKLRQSFAKSSVSKYSAILNMEQEDHRVRSTLMYNAAHTGRWGGKGIQVHNLPSRGLIKDPDFALSVVKSGASPSFLEILWGSPMKVASSCIRSCLVAEEGKEFICADYSSIEGRVLAWLAGEQYVLDSYIEGLDPYKVAASGALGVKYEDITKDQRQIGKIIELFCGYQGWIGAFESAAKSFGIFLPEEQVKENILDWRASRPLTVRLWKQMYAAAELAMLEPGKVSEYRGVRFQFKNKHLRCTLPSNRIIWYPFAEVRDDVNMWGKHMNVISYMVEDSQSKQWMRKDTYGGKLVENIVQAMGADILSKALVVLTRRGWSVVLHVHDEVVCEEPIGMRTVQELVEAMCELPPWAKGLPLAADGWAGPRYKKD